MRFSQILVLGVLCACVFVFAPVSIAAKDEWIQVRSKNFNLIGNANEKDIRKVATKLEQFRETFRQLFTGTNFTATIPTNVVVFKSDGAYKPFKPIRADGKTDNFIAGYFQSGEDVNYITLSTEGEDDDTFGTIFHEYVHFIVNTNFGKSEVPPWFNEGLAEYYQTFAIEKDQNVKLGLPQSNHLLLLQQNKLIPLETLFKISNYALAQNGNHSRSIFYAESWALIHYLLQNGKSEGLSKFLLLSMKDTAPEKAFQDSFQMNYAQMEKELKKYVAQNSYKYTNVTFKNKMVFDAEMQVSPLAEAETDAYLGDLLYHTNRADDAETYLQKAVTLTPDSSMANTTLGMVKMKQRKYDDAKKYLEKAISENQKSHIAFYDYAYLLSRENRDDFGHVNEFPTEKAEKMRGLLKKAIALNPRFTESYELLAFVNLVNNEQLDESVAYLKKALAYQAGNQRYALRIADIYLRQKKFAEAQNIADKIAKTSDEPETKARAEQLIAQIGQYQQFEKNNEEAQKSNEEARKQYEAAIAEARKNGDKIILKRREATMPEKTLTPEELAKEKADAEISGINNAIHEPNADEKQVVGRIQKVDCKSDSILYTIKAGAETFQLTSKDLKNLTLTSYVTDLGNANVNCDANIARLNTVLTYKQSSAAKNVRGELIAVDFVPPNFRLMSAEEKSKEAETEIATQEAATQEQNQDAETQRRTAMMNVVKSAMRKPQNGEKREIGIIEKVECNNKGTAFYLKTTTKTFKLSVSQTQPLQIRAFTPEVEGVQFGCRLKQLNVPTVFTFKETANSKDRFDGELISLELMPKNFVLEN